VTSPGGAHVDEVGDDDRLVAMRTRAAGAELAGEQVAVGATTDVEQSLLAARTLIHLRPGRDDGGSGCGKDTELNVSAAMGAQATTPGAESGAG
jgi:hypothetical protein